jgi:hypothetical protein
MQTSCMGTGYAVNCVTTGGQYSPPAYVMIDQNVGARDSASRSCLMSAGWIPVKDKAEAAAVTNSGAPEAPAQEVTGNLGSTLSQRVHTTAVSDCQNMFYMMRNQSLMEMYDNDYNKCVRVHSHELESKM